MPLNLVYEKMGFPLGKYEMYGRKLLFLIGFAVFAIASLLCGFAPDLVWLVVFRILQGIGGGMLGANAVSILVKCVDPQRRTLG